MRKPSKRQLRKQAKQLKNDQRFLDNRIVFQTEAVANKRYKNHAVVAQFKILSIFAVIVMAIFYIVFVSYGSGYFHFSGDNAMFGWTIVAAFAIIFLILLFSLLKTMGLVSKKERYIRQGKFKVADKKKGESKEPVNVAPYLMGTPNAAIAAQPAPAPQPEAKPSEEEAKKAGMLSGAERFQRLTILDEECPEWKPVRSTPGLDLASFCERFRNYAAADFKHLYYSIDDIRRFVASMGVSRILVLQGMSGTGKTSLPTCFGRFMRNPTSVVPVQPMWKERSDLLGYYNEFTGKFNETQILEDLYRANQSDRVCLVVLDEMNIARVEYYFAEFLSLLELPAGSSRLLEVTSSIGEGDPRLLKAGKLVLPDNVWFIGTANNDDSTFAISDKVYDRAMVMNLDNRAEPFEPEGDCSPAVLSYTDFAALVERAKREYALTQRSRRRISRLDAFLKREFGVTFGNRIMRQMEAYVPIYVACGGEELDAIDDMLAKKVLRKLEAQNPVYVKNKAPELQKEIDDVFGMGRMAVCREAIAKMTRNG